MIRNLLTPVAVAVFFVVAPVCAQINVGSTGVDGVFQPQSSVVVDLATQGTYDPVNWRVVFNFQSVHIPPGVVVTFTNHPSRAPVVWLSQGDILIEGTVNLRGQDGLSAPNYVRSEPGPGGFRGGNGAPGLIWSHSGGLGPGGGPCDYHYPWGHRGSGGGYATAGGASHNGPGGVAYGDPELTWLVGGSGGAGGCPSVQSAVNSTGGGAGGGAILLASDTMAHVTSQGTITVNGGDGGPSNAKHGGGGSGGGVRIVAHEVRLDAGAIVHAKGGFTGHQWGNGGLGRIRLEANVMQMNTQSVPPASQGVAGTILPPVGSPTVEIVQVAGQAVPPDPVAGLSAGSGIADLNLISGQGAVVLIRTTNVALNSQVYLHVTKDNGQHDTLLVTDGATNPLVVTGGPQMEAEVSYTLNLAVKHSALQVRVVLP